MTMRMAKFALVAAVLAPLPSAAHHSYSMFDMNKTVAMQATIVRFKWQNPTPSSSWMPPRAAGPSAGRSR